MPGPGEPLWSDDDQDAALAYFDWMRADRLERCGTCGTRTEDWIDAETGRVLRSPAYMAKVRVCEGCRELAAGREQLEELVDRDGASVVLVPFIESDEDDEDGRMHPDLDRASADV